jgi:hypothetical protein
MKKTLLACSLIVSSVFFASAQLQVGDVKVNLGQICGTYNGKPACYNQTTGQWQVTTGNGTGVSGNVNTGTVSGAGTIGGVRIGGSGNIGIGGGTGSVGTNLNFSGPLGLLALAQTIVSRLVPFLVGLAVVVFFWFLVTFIWKGKDNPEEQKKGRAGMMYSLLAIFVMVSLWGIITFIGGILGIGQGGSISGFNLPGEGAK